MAQLVAFRNAQGNLGLIQKDGNHVSYYVHTDQEFYKITGSNGWASWVGQVDAGYAEGCKEKITVESIRYYMNNYAETLSLDIVDFAEILNPGVYYPRIVRENIQFDYVSEEFLQDARAFRNIQTSLDELFNYIEPSAANLAAYGHKIRELLILACTEVECLLVKVLVDNGYPAKERYSTKDYVVCKSLLALHEYEANLVQYPSLKVFNPFLSWDSSSPTKSLPWYDAYNAVKHNRSDNIADANLEHLLDAISAIHILLESQYGRNIFNRWDGHTDDKSIFRTSRHPVWACNEICAPLLIPGYSVKSQWTEKHKYFEDFPS